MSLSAISRVPVVPQGPRAFRYRIRRRGAFVALFPAIVMGVAAYALLTGGGSTTRGVLGLGAAVLAAPGLLAAGVPLAEGARPLLLGAGLSALVWMLVGLVAARRATRSPVATWADFWREYLWLACGLWLGVGVGLIAAKMMVGGGLL